jgi:hypothetical protein
MLYAIIPKREAKYPIMNGERLFESPLIHPVRVYSTVFDTDTKTPKSSASHFHLSESPITDYQMRMGWVDLFVQSVNGKDENEDPHAFDSCILCGQTLLLPFGTGRLLL